MQWLILETDPQFKTKTHKPSLSGSQATGSCKAQKNGRDQAEHSSLNVCKIKDTDPFNVTTRQKQEITQIYFTKHKKQKMSNTLAKIVCKFMLSFSWL